MQQEGLDILKTALKKYPMRLKYLLFISFIGLVACATGDQKDEKPKESDLYSQDAIKAYLEKPAEKGELFRIYANSQNYQVVQLANQDTIELKPDEGGNKAVCEEIDRYNMADFFVEGVLKVELYPHNGSFYRVRQVKPSGVKELDKLFSEDITRWQFNFPKGEINPREFKIRFGVDLINKMNRQEAQELLKKYAR